jgi:toxin ParE1/3/4
VVWTKAALRRLEDIRDYVAVDSPARAGALVRRLRARAKQLSEFPYSGHMLLELEAPWLREILEGSYRIIYRVSEQRIEIVAVVHTSQNPPWARRAE